MEEIECCVISENPCKNSKIVKSILEEPLEEKKMQKVFRRSMQSSEGAPPQARRIQIPYMPRICEIDSSRS